MRDSEGSASDWLILKTVTTCAARAIEALNGERADRKQWYVGQTQKKPEREAELRASFEQEHKGRIQLHPNVNLFIQNLQDDTIDDEMLWNFFAQFETLKLVVQSYEEHRG